MSETTKRRITYLDSAKGIAIIAVVVLHILGNVKLSDPRPFMDPVIVYFDMFTIPMFIMCSGALLKLTGVLDKPWKEFAAKRFRQIMVPYFSFSIIALGLHIYRLHMKSGAEMACTIPQDIMDVVTLRGFSVLWYLPMLYFAGLFWFWVKKCMQKFPEYLSSAMLWLLGIGILFGSTVVRMPIWQENMQLRLAYCILLVIFRSILAAAYLEIGYRSIRLIEESKTPDWVLSGIGALLIILSFELQQKVGIADINSLSYYRPIGDLLVVLMSCLGIILVCKTAFHYCNWLQWIGQKSLIIMVTHLDFLVLEYSLGWAYRINNHISHAKTPILYLSILALVVFWQGFWIIILERYFGILLGKKRQ